jgi:hypothetical protein
MAQVVHTGLMGNATGVPGRIFAWTMNRIFEVLESTGFGSTERDREQGLGDAVGEIMSYVTSGAAGDTYATALVQGVRAFVLTSNTGCTFTFSGLLSNVGFESVDIGEGRRAQVSRFAFVKKGAFTIAWVTA